MPGLEGTAPQRLDGHRLGGGQRGGRRCRPLLVLHRGDRPPLPPGFPPVPPVEGRDDVAELIAQHRNELPFFDQLPALDPPVHTDHRALLMRLITPKRLKENEDAMWTMVDRRSTATSSAPAAS